MIQKSCTDALKIDCMCTLPAASVLQFRVHLNKHSENARHHSYVSRPQVCKDFGVPGAPCIVYQRCAYDTTANACEVTCASCISATASPPPLPPAPPPPPPPTVGWPTCPSGSTPKAVGSTAINPGAGNACDVNACNAACPQVCKCSCLLGANKPRTLIQKSCTDAHKSPACCVLHPAGSKRFADSSAPEQTRAKCPRLMYPARRSASSLGSQVHLA